METVVLKLYTVTGWLNFVMFWHILAFSGQITIYSAVKSGNSFSLIHVRDFQIVFCMSFRFKKTVKFIAFLGFQLSIKLHTI
jgi:hypothetical protein